MCLSTVDTKKLRRCGTGYKVVEKYGKGDYRSFDFFSCAGTRYAPIGHWTSDPNPQVDCGYPSYKSGFHVSLNLKAMKALKKRVWASPLCYVIVAVKFRKVTATSITFPNSTYGPQVVAGEIMLLKEIPV